MTLPINLGASSGNPSGYPIQRSLRFRSSASANLTRTPSSTGNRKTWTWSAWLKRGSIAQTGTIWGSNFSSGGFGLAFGNYGGAGVNPEIMGVTLYAVGTVTTNAVFRDPSAWYHIVAKFDSTQATQANRFALYVNGVQQTLSGTLNVTLNADYNVNLSGALHVIGGESGYYNDCYLAEVNFIDGQALTPSSFGATDAVTGAWQPKKYTGTYGTNGFYLPFSDNTSATTLAYDKSGNSNNWTPNNISTTAGATYDSMTDVPTLTSATAANYAVLNPLWKDAAVVIADGNLNVSNGNYGGVSTITMPTGNKYYCEVTVTATEGNQAVGIVQAAALGGSIANIGLLGGYAYGYYSANGQKYVLSAASAYGSSWGTIGDVIGIAADLSGNTVTFYKNGVSQGAISIASGTDYLFGASNATATGGVAFNFGQRPFSYTPPTGYKALNTFNLPDPVIKKPSTYMDATLYTGTGSNQSITNASGFQPDLVWLKKRGGNANLTWHLLADAVRGTGNTLSSNQTYAEYTGKTSVTAFNSNGFNLGADATTNPYYGWNINADTYVGWQWKKGATPGFDIVTYTGNGTAGNTVSHSLGIAPKLVIIKARAGTFGWYVYTSMTGAGNYLALNTTAASSAGSGLNGVAPTSTTITLGGAGWGTNENGTSHVAYLFAEIPGFSKFGSYTGNGSTDGPFVYCGFRPKYVMIKSSSAVADWYIFDSVRETYNPLQQALEANLSNAEDTWINHADDFLANGFKVRNSWANQNNSGTTYIFACFAESPFKYANAR